ncbi:putative UDP-3-O-acylglucosamine N-acyltransferase 2, mitochondrial isoform X2 [Wolffia australiana]
MGRKIVAGVFHWLPKQLRGCSTTPLFMFCTSRDCNSSSEFSRWSNGGGYFHRSAVIDPSVKIDIGAVVHSNAKLDQDVHVGSGAVIGASVSIGKSTKIGYNAVLGNCSLGMSCTLHSGVCIGQDGFGFFVDGDRCVKKKPQTLQVKIGNDVEVGANTCIDRGRIGDYVTMGGRAAVRDHVSITSNVRLAANSGVTKDLPFPGDYAGFPAIPVREWRRQILSSRRLDDK